MAFTVDDETNEWVVRRSFPAASNDQRRQLRDEPRLVVEAAQVDDERAVLDAADHRHRQRAERRGDALRGRARELRPAAPATAMPALGSESTGSEPLPIWLEQARTLRLRARPERARARAGSERAAPAASIRPAAA